VKIDKAELNKKDKFKVDNAIIMAAGVSSRFAPISYECPKALLRVRDEILIERQIMQLKEAGINDITVVVGYKKELFYYLKDKFDVDIVENPEYLIRNNNSTLYYVRDRLVNTYICSADNYFTKSVFETYVDRSYYSAVFEKGITNEWCINADSTGLINNVVVGGKDSWVMLGHAFFTKDFSKTFVNILEKIYAKPSTKPLFWENIYIEHLDELPMYIQKYSDNIIFEFDSLDELRKFDESYWDHTGSKILKKLCIDLNCNERDIANIKPINSGIEAVGFSFNVKNIDYNYLYNDKGILKVGK
jgi:CTP:phosphocholine cytidylyltransferase-like protein